MPSGGRQSGVEYRGRLPPRPESIRRKNVAETSLAHSAIPRCELFQRFVNHKEFIAGRAQRDLDRVDVNYVFGRRLASNRFLISSAVKKNSPHRFGGCRKKMTSTVPVLSPININ